MEIYLSEIFNTKGKQDLKEFLWADYRKGIWNGAFLSDLLKQYTSKYGMHGLGFREYRQVATAFMEKHLKYKLNEIGLEMDAFLDLQAGHTSRTASTSYAVSFEDHRSVSREAWIASDGGGKEEETRYIHSIFVWNLLFRRFGSEKYF